MKLSFNKSIFVIFAVLTFSGANLLHYNRDSKFRLTITNAYADPGDDENSKFSYKQKITDTYTEKHPNGDDCTYYDVVTTSTECGGNGLLDCEPNFDYNATYAGIGPC